MHPPAAPTSKPTPRLWTLPQSGGQPPFHARPGLPHCLHTLMPPCFCKIIKEQYGLHPDDIFMSGDTDEIVSAKAVWQLKHCEIPHRILHAATWMPAGGDLNRAMGTGFHPPGMPFTHVCPTIYKMNAVKHFGICNQEPCYDGGREFQGRSAHVRGGIHMTWIPALPHVYLKDMTATEYQVQLISALGGSVCRYVFSLTRSSTCALKGRMGVDMHVQCKVARGACSSVVERPLCMREVQGSNPCSSNLYHLVLAYLLSQGGQG